MGGSGSSGASFVLAPAFPSIDGMQDMDIIAEKEILEWRETPLFPSATISPSL